MKSIQHEKKEAITQNIESNESSSDSFRSLIIRYMESVFSITKDHEHYGIGILLSDRIMELDVETRKQLKFSVVQRFINHLINETIYIDNVFYSLIANYYGGVIKLKEHERLTYLIAKYQEENNVLIGVECFTENAYKYMCENNINIHGRISMSELPINISAETMHYTNIKFIYIYTLLKADNSITRPKIYNADDVLSMARRLDRKETKGIWFNPNQYSDTIEMMKKTALRNYMKYFIYPRNE